MLNRARGFSLVELLVALALTLVLAAAVAMLVANARALTRFQLARMGVQRSLRTAQAYLARELAPLDPAAGDILGLAPGSIRFRGQRGLAFLCAFRPGVLTVRKQPRFGLRPWVPGRDSLLVFVGGSGGGAGDRWVAAPLRGLMSGATCADGSAGIDLSTVAGPGYLPAPGIFVGGPVRVFEATEVRLYRSGGVDWLGIRSLAGGGTVQPALGPLTTRGFEVRLLDSGGAAITDPARAYGLVATVGARSRGPERRSRGGQPAILRDSVSVVVTFRNPGRRPGVASAGGIGGP